MVSFPQPSVLKPPIDRQAETLEYYEANAEEYAKRTLSVDLSNLYQPFLSLVPEGGHLLDAGCGAGRDTRYFLEQGYRVTSFDGSGQMARISSRITGQNTLHKRFDEIEFVAQFDGVWANASLLHVPPRGIDNAVSRLTRALKPRGTFFASFKYGERDFVEDGRYFNCYTEESLERLLAKHRQLEPIRIWMNDDSSREELTWLNVLARRHNKIRS